MHSCTSQAVRSTASVSFSCSSSSQCLRYMPRKFHLPSLSRSSRPLHSTRTLHEQDTPTTTTTATTNTIPPLHPQPELYSYKHTRLHARAPHRVRPLGPEFKVNDDPDRLNAMYSRLLGPQSPDFLPEHIKWQAVTHKSFDHGMQPYNDKLAFMGRRVLFLEANLHILNKPVRSPTPTAKTQADPDTPPETVSSLLNTYLKPTPFTHPDYRNIDEATYDAVTEQTSEDRLSLIARIAGIPGVMRWKPASPKDLFRSGSDTVATECLYAIVGAIALLRGGHEASQFIRERILANSNPEQR